MGNYIDTRDLIEERDNHYEMILNEFNDRFNMELDEFSDIETFLDDEASESITKEDREEFFEYMADEYNSIREIDELESYISSREFDYGLTLIPEDDFEEYAEDLITDCGYISKDLPGWIEIDWEATANNIKVDYGEVDFRGETYLFRY
jgi:hypothetical protein